MGVRTEREIRFENDKTWEGCCDDDLVLLDEVFPVAVVDESDVEEVVAPEFVDSV